MRLRVLIERIKLRFSLLIVVIMEDLSEPLLGRSGELSVLLRLLLNILLRLLLVVLLLRLLLVVLLLLLLGLSEELLLLGILLRDRDMAC